MHSRFPTGDTPTDAGREFRFNVAITDEVLAYFRDVIGLDLEHEFTTRPMAELMPLFHVDGQPELLPKLVWRACQPAASVLDEWQFQEAIASDIRTFGNALIAFYSALEVRFPNRTHDYHVPSPSTEFTIRA